MHGDQPCSPDCRGRSGSHGTAYIDCRKSDAPVNLADRAVAAVPRRAEHRRLAADLCLATLQQRHPQCCSLALGKHCFGTKAATNRARVTHTVNAGHGRPFAVQAE